MSAPNHPEKQFTVTVYIFNPEGKILLIKHPKLGVWMPPGGHLESDETPTEGASRELSEEVGLDLTFPEEDMGSATLIRSPDYTLVEDLGDHNHIDLIYIVEHEEFKPKLEKGLVGYMWAEPDELNRLQMIDNTRALIMRILSEKF